MAATGVSFRTDTRTLASMVDARVSVITNDGRHIVGVLRGFDQVVNVILEDCHERVYSTTSGVEHAPLGLYMIRGDNMCVLCSRSCVCCCVLLCASSRGVDLKPTPQRLTWSFRVLHDITEPSSVRSTKI
jgi:U6 snRNA-associated Sm-like protein LSm8